MPFIFTSCEKQAFHLHRQKQKGRPPKCQAKLTAPEALHERVEHVSVAGETSDKSSVYTSAELAKVGSLIDCPQCGTAFTKANKWHTFCKSSCKDTWHNERNPERLAHAKRKRVEP